MSDRKRKSVAGCLCVGGGLRSFLQPRLLLRLAGRPAHGYELMEELAGEPEYAEPDAGTLYRALRLLEEDGLVQSEWDTAESGPAKRVYQLTDHGRDCLRSWTICIRKTRAQLDRFLEEHERVNTDEGGVVLGGGDQVTVSSGRDRLVEAVRLFLKPGATSFGGPTAGIDRTEKGAVGRGAVVPGEQAMWTRRDGLVIRLVALAAMVAACAGPAATAVQSPSAPAGTPVPPATAPAGTPVPPATAPAGIPAAAPSARTGSPAQAAETARHFYELVGQGQLPEAHALCLELQWIVVDDGVYRAVGVLPQAEFVAQARAALAGQISGTGTGVPALLPPERQAAAEHPELWALYYLPVATRVLAVHDVPAGGIVSEPGRGTEAWKRQVLVAELSGEAGWKVLLPGRPPSALQPSAAEWLGGRPFEGAELIGPPWSPGEP